MEYENDILTISNVDTDEETPIRFKAKETTNPITKKESQRFTDYSFAPRKKNYKEFEIIQTYRPIKKEKQKKDSQFADFVKEQNSYSPDKETFIYEKAKPMPKIKHTSKIFVCICCAIAVLFGTIGIINAFKINELQYNNLSTTQEIANIGKEIVKVEQVIEGMTSEEQIQENAEKNGMEEITSKTEIQLNEKNKVEKYERKTNFFDKICNFFSSMFGG